MSGVFLALALLWASGVAWICGEVLLGALLILVGFFVAVANLYTALREGK